MASNEAPVSKDHIILTLSVETLTYILTHSASSDQKLNVKSLFSVVENILNRATKIVDKVFLTRHGPGKARQEAGYFNFPWRTEHIDEMASFSSFNLGREKSLTKGFVPPLCAFKDISSELKCKAPTEETALSIFKKLSSYSADEKVVLTLATFALEYGEFCLLANNIQSTDQLAKSMGILRGVPNLLENVEKHREVVDDLNKVIKTTLKVIQCIFDLRNLPNKGKRGFLAEPVYWAIATIVASSTQLCYLISHEEKKQELQPYDHKLKVILTDLTKLKKPETRGVDDAVHVSEDIDKVGITGKVTIVSPPRRPTIEAGSSIGVGSLSGEVVDFLKEFDAKAPNPHPEQYFWSFNGPLVPFGDFWVPNDCSPYLSRLSAGHSDFTKGFKLKIGLGGPMLSLLGSMLAAMDESSFEDVTKTQILAWRSVIQDLMDVGFDLGFMIERLRQTAQCLFGKRIADERKALQHQIALLQDSLAELTAYQDEMMSTGRMVLRSERSGSFLDSLLD